MRKNHQPYAVKKLVGRISHAYVQHIVRPQFDQLGESPRIMAPRHLVLCGSNISVGDHAHFICAQDNKIRLTTWPEPDKSARITIGNYCLLTPGTRISAASSISIGDNCMIASNCYISDSDWHGVYNRTRPFRCTEPVTLANNVWLGERVIICKGVTIGDNSVIGAGSVVTRDIPANVVAAGNPAKVIREINPRRHMLRREQLFRPGFADSLESLDRQIFTSNGWLNWIRSVINPGKHD